MIISQKGLAPVEVLRICFNVYDVIDLHGRVFGVTGIHLGGLNEPNMITIREHWKAVEGEVRTMEFSVPDTLLASAIVSGEAHHYVYNKKESSR